MNPGPQLMLLLKSKLKQSLEEEDEISCSSLGSIKMAMSDPMNLGLQLMHKCQLFWEFEEQSNKLTPNFSLILRIFTLLIWLSKLCKLNKLI